MSNQTMKTSMMALETVKEREFTFDHPEVGIHTDMFFGLQKRANLFDSFDGIQKPSRDLAVVLGTFWCLFSAFMPRFASRAAGMVRDNLKRHFVIQTPFEELGGRDGSQIHADLFVQALRLAEVEDIDFLRWCSFRPIAEALEGLEKSLTSADTDHQVLGILHGLEIPAEEIIDRLFVGLAHSEDVREALDGSTFFVIHRQIEVEHIRRGTANFLRFCPELDSKIRFMKGFSDALTFWKLFWDGVATASVSQLA
jgi:Iron-containing redox enzyme